MILKQLRSETAQQHAAIEKQLPLLNPNLTRNAYVQLVARFWGYYAPLEAQLEHVYPIAFDGKERLKTPLLERDLQSLGQSQAAFLHCTSLPPLTDLPQVLGCLYVIEGATLGGQVISRQLQTTLGLTCDSGAAFFSGYGALTGIRWRAFCNFLTETAPPLGQDKTIIASANATFETLGLWLEQTP